MWLSTKEASELLGLTAPTLYRMINDGQIPAYRFGRVIRLKASDVEAFVASSSKIKPRSIRVSHDGPLIERRRA
jgi:excisionase family DNA binding protein